MGARFAELSEKHISFISRQKLFFVGTATDTSRVNISPKGMDSFRVVSATEVMWLNVTGSGNETAAHVQQHPRMTIMFAAFEGKPLILRLYGTATAVHRNDPAWSELYAKFPPSAGARQIFVVSVDLVQSSCGMAVPFYDYVGEREQLSDWAKQQGEEGIKAYWLNKNQQSIDGLPTDIAERNT